MRSHTLGRLTILGLIGLLMLGVGGCTTNPATGKRIVTLYDWDWEKRIGAEASMGLAEQFGGEVDDVIPSQYVRTVGMKLVAGVEEAVPELDWEFTLLNTDVINAFALPGGKVFFTRGLAEKLESEAAMAGVLGHEIGHVTGRHGNQSMSKQFGYNAGVAISGAFVGSADSDSKIRKYGQVLVPAVAVSGKVLLLKYGRSSETEADMLGMRYMERAGYNPIGQLRVMEVLMNNSKGSRAPEWLSTHPYPKSRIDEIGRLLAGEYAHTQDNSAYVFNRDQYEQRMLLPLRNLPRPVTDPEETTTLLDAPALWCGHCRTVALK